MNCHSNKSTPPPPEGPLLEFQTTNALFQNDFEMWPTPVNESKSQTISYDDSDDSFFTRLSITVTQQRFSVNIVCMISDHLFHFERIMMRTRALQQETEEAISSKLRVDVKKKRRRKRKGKKKGVVVSHAIYLCEVSGRRNRFKGQILLLHYSLLVPKEQCLRFLFEGKGGRKVQCVGV
ncbi:hypothetical protein CEXT_253491 [Caerostris extrusa]|uniref:Uncharacterized protein n=1 Tax=Caerostris extrusa TaxID=172846 RepID=A0AAV4N3J1_CAEEX|nr:hypothetical protein CEXT_253491 [Caerostris extrusa]